MYTEWETYFMFATTPQLKNGVRKIRRNWIDAENKSIFHLFPFESNQYCEEVICFYYCHIHRRSSFWKIYIPLDVILSLYFLWFSKVVFIYSSWFFIRNEIFGIHCICSWLRLFLYLWEPGTALCRGLYLSLYLSCTCV